MEPGPQTPDLAVKAAAQPQAPSGFPNFIRHRGFGLEALLAIAAPEQRPLFASGGH